MEAQHCRKAGHKNHKTTFMGGFRRCLGLCSQIRLCGLQTVEGKMREARLSRSIPDRFRIRRRTGRRLVYSLPLASSLVVSAGMATFKSAVSTAAASIIIAGNSEGAGAGVKCDKAVEVYGTRPTSYLLSVLQRLKPTQGGAGDRGGIIADAP